jgi:hypothetical protein
MQVVTLDDSMSALMMEEEVQLTAGMAYWFLWAWSMRSIRSWPCTTPALSLVEGCDHSAGGEQGFSEPPATLSLMLRLRSLHVEKRREPPDGEESTSPEQLGSGLGARLADPTLPVARRLKPGSLGYPGGEEPEQVLGASLTAPAARHTSAARLLAGRVATPRMEDERRAIAAKTCRHNGDNFTLSGETNRLAEQRRWHNALRCTAELRLGRLRSCRSTATRTLRARQSICQGALLSPWPSPPLSHLPWNNAV